jgi:hypothetical protein
MRARTATLLALTLPLLDGCRVFPAPTEVGTANATTIVSPSQYGDAQLLSCGPGATAQVTITNHGPTPANYTITVAYRSDGGRVVTRGVLEVSQLAAGQTAASPAPGAPVENVLTCAIEDVQRHPAG